MVRFALKANLGTKKKCIIRTVKDYNLKHSALKNSSSAIISALSHMQG